MRLIDADDLQRKICGAKCGCEYEDCANEHDCEFDFFIFHAPTIKPKQEWISVKDRLPEDKGSYLAYGNHILFGEVMNSAGVYVDKYLGKFGWKHQKDMKITHWMPLPEPPEKDGDK